MPQRHPQRPAGHGGPGRGHRPPRHVLLRQGAGRHPLRAGRLHHEPRRRLALPRPRPQPGAGRHDRPHALGRPPRRRGAGRLGGHPALLLGPRGVPAHLPAGGDGRPGHRVPPPRPPLPPLRHPLPGRGRDLPGRAPAQRGPGRARRRGPRIVGRARTDLEFRRLQDLVADLPGHLRSLQTACHEAGDAVARRFFRQAAALEWSLRGWGPTTWPGASPSPTPPATGTAGRSPRPTTRPASRPSPATASWCSSRRWRSTRPPSPSATGTTGARSSTPSTSRCPTSSCR